MRIVAGSAPQFSGALQKALRFAQSVARVRHFETRVLTPLQIECKAEVREEGWPGMYEERSAVEALERMSGSGRSLVFEMALDRQTSISRSGLRRAGLTIAARISEDATPLRLRGCSRTCHWPGPWHRRQSDSLWQAAAYIAPPSLPPDVPPARADTRYGRTCIHSG